jgi:hypothetical protein
VTTLTDDLNVLLSWAQTTYPGTPSSVDSDAGTVDIAFGFREAVVMSASYTEEGKLWYAEAMQWDASGGICEDLHIAEGFDLHPVLVEVAKFLMTQANNDEKLELRLEGRPED